MKLSEKHTVPRRLGEASLSVISTSSLNVMCCDFLGTGEDHLT